MSINKKNTALLFLFLGGQMHLVSISLFYRFVETIFKMKLNTLVTKYKDIFNFQLCTYHVSSECHFKGV